MAGQEAAKRGREKTQGRLWRPAHDPRGPARGGQSSDFSHDKNYFYVRKKSEPQDNSGPFKGVLVVEAAALCGCCYDFFNRRDNKQEKRERFSHALLSSQLTLRVSRTTYQKDEATALFRFARRWWCFLHFFLLLRER